MYRPAAPRFRPVVSLEEELARIRRGTAEIFPEEELLPRLVAAREEGRPLVVKLGVDPTATELHLGHLIPVLKLRTFQELGHQAVLIIGDYTATVGDPSGRNQARPPLSHEEALANSRTYQDQVFRILDPERTQVLYNGSWFACMVFSDVLRLLSRMTLARMLEREDFKKRLAEQSPIGLHELVYPLMQGYDSVQIRADVELGGIDQKFNILVGRELQREAGQPPQVGVCNPLLLGTDGVHKMSKSLGNTIALADPPEEKFGKIMSIPDSLMRSYYELLTEVPLEEISRLFEGLESAAYHPRDLKERLARAVVSRFDGEVAARRAQEHFRRVFRERALPEEIPDLLIPPRLLREGRVWLPRLLVWAGFASSHGEARRLMEQGGVRIDDSPQTDPAGEWVARDGAVLQVGKRRFARLRLE